MGDVAGGNGYYEMRRRGVVRKPDPNDWTQSFVNSSKIKTAALKPKSKRPSGARKKPKRAPEEPATTDTTIDDVQEYLVSTKRKKHTVVDDSDGVTSP